MDKLKSRSAIRHQNNSLSRSQILAQYNDGRTVSPVYKRRRNNDFEEDNQNFTPFKPSKIHQYKLYNNYYNSQSENNSVDASTDENGIKYTRKRSKNKSNFYNSNQDTPRVKNVNSKNPFTNTNNFRNFLQNVVATNENENYFKPENKQMNLRKQIHLKKNIERVNSGFSNYNSKSIIRFSQIGDSFQLRQSCIDDTNLYSDTCEAENLKRCIDGQDQTAQFESIDSQFKLQDKQDSEIIKAYQQQKLQKLQEIFYQHLRDKNENEMNAKIILNCLSPEQQIDYMQKILANTSKRSLLEDSSQQNVFKDKLSMDTKNNKKSMEQILSQDDNLIIMKNTLDSIQLQPIQNNQKIVNVKQKLQTMQELMEQLQDEVQTLDQNNQSEQKIIMQFQNMIGQINNDKNNILQPYPRSNKQNNRKNQLRILTTATEQNKIRGFEIQQTPKLEKINIRVSRSPQQTNKRNNVNIQQKYEQISQFQVSTPYVKQHLQNLQKPQFEIKPNFKTPQYIQQNNQKEKFNQ